MTSDPLLYKHDRHDFPLPDELPLSGLSAYLFDLLFAFLLQGLLSGELSSFDLIRVDSEG